MKQIYSEEDFKTVLKTLFEEKSLVQKLENKLKKMEKEHAEKIIENLERIELLEGEKKLLIEEKKKLETLSVVLQKKEEKKEPILEENKDFESERQALIAKLAETLTKLQKQYEINKNLRYEIAILQREI